MHITVECTNQNICQFCPSRETTFVKVIFFVVVHTYSIYCFCNVFEFDCICYLCKALIIVSLKPYLY
jgi:hypothetical protein